MIEKSLKMISEGKMCVVIDATASMQLLESDEPACTKKNLGFGLPVNFSILEFFFKRLKDLGSLAVEKFGKNYGFNREPILVVVAVSEGDIDEVDEELVKNGYYGYQGVLCFCTDISPHLDLQKKILIRNTGHVNYDSSGTGAVISGFSKQKLFRKWRENNIQYINICSTQNLNSKICDPMSFAYLINSNFDCLADVVPNSSQSTDYPCILEESEGEYSEFYPFEIKKIHSQNLNKLDFYTVPYTNIFTSVDYLKRICVEKHREIHDYRIREMFDGFGEENFCYEERIFNDKKTENKNDLPLKFRFVLSGFGLMKAGKRNCLLLRNPDDLILFDNRQILKYGLERLKKDVKKRFEYNSKQHFKRFNKFFESVQGRGKISEKRKFEAYLNHYFSLRRCKEFLFENFYSVRNPPQALSPHPTHKIQNMNVRNHLLKNIENYSIPQKKMNFQKKSSMNQQNFRSFQFLNKKRNIEGQRRNRYQTPILNQRRAISPQVRIRDSSGWQRQRQVFVSPQSNKFQRGQGMIGNNGYLLG